MLRGDTRGRRLLLIEDDDSMEFIFSHFAKEPKHGGWEITRAKTGAEALAAIKQSSFDMIVIDNKFPLEFSLANEQEDMLAEYGSGLVVADRIRQNLDFKDVPIIMNTSNEQTPIFRQLAKQVGIQHVHADEHKLQEKSILPLLDTINDYRLTHPRTVVKCGPDALHRAMLPGYASGPVSGPNAATRARLPGYQER